MGKHIIDKINEAKPNKIKTVDQFILPKRVILKFINYFWLMYFIHRLNLFGRNEIKKKLLFKRKKIAK